jgi:hypothetical protein
MLVVRKAMPMAQSWPQHMTSPLLTQVRYPGTEARPLMVLQWMARSYISSNAYTCWKLANTIQCTDLDDPDRQRYAIPSISFSSSPCPYHWPSAMSTIPHIAALSPLGLHERPTASWWDLGA